MTNYQTCIMKDICLGYCPDCLGFSGLTVLEDAANFETYSSDFSGE